MPLHGLEVERNAIRRQVVDRTVKLMHRCIPHPVRRRPPSNRCDKLPSENGPPVVTGHAVPPPDARIVKRVPSSESVPRKPEIQGRSGRAARVLAKEETNVAVIRDQPPRLGAHGLLPKNRPVFKSLHG